MSNLKKVRQSNEFVEAPYSTELTTHEIKIIEYIVADCKEIDLKLTETSYSKEYRFTATELSKILNTSVSRVVIDADKLSNSITGKRIIEKKLGVNGDIEEFLYVPLITFAQYSKGVFEFGLNYKVLRHFINVQKNFTEFQLHYLLSMNSSYAIKLYKILYQYKNIKFRVFVISELKEQFGIPNKYPQYKNFKQRILDPSVKQINQLTDLNVDYREIKLGRKIESIEFSFNLKNTLLFDNSTQQTTITSSGLSSDTTRIVHSIENRITNKTKALLNEYYLKHGEKYIVANICYAKENAKKNFDKYLQDSLINHWGIDQLNKMLESEITELNNITKKEKSKKMQKEKSIQRKNDQENIKNQFLSLHGDERANIFTELVSKISTKSPDKLMRIIKEKDEFSIAYWAEKNSLVYNGSLQLFIACLKG